MGQEERRLFFSRRHAHGRLCPQAPAGLPLARRAPRGERRLPARALSGSSGVRFSEATDLLGAQRSGYAAGTRVMAAVRVQPQRRNALREAPLRRAWRGAGASTRPRRASQGRRTARPRPGPGLTHAPAPRPPGLSSTPTPPTHPGPAPRLPVNPAKPGMCAPVSRLCVPPPTHPAPRQGGRGLRASGPPPATYRPPCPAPSSRALRVQPQLGSAGRRRLLRARFRGRPVLGR